MANTRIALFRGINVGGRNILPMKELAALMRECGYADIRTYIQSGNVMFSAPTTSDPDISRLIENKFGFKPEVLILSCADLEAAIANNPYSEAAGNQCHFGFCKSMPTDINTTKLNELKAPTEEFVVLDRVFYLYAPDGIGRSKLAAKIESCMGVPVTSRNLNTVNKLWGMVDSL